MASMIYSNSLNEMVVKGFTTQKILFSNDGTGKMIESKNIFHYTWNDTDCLYYRDDVDDKYYMEIPENGTKTYLLKIGYHARLKVVLD